VRNKRILKDELNKLIHTSSKPISLLDKNMQQRIRAQDQGLDSEEEALVMKLNFVHNESSSKIHKIPAQKNWMIRMQPMEFLDWKV
jgi:hypothetical protein